jgi:hypothetical protein
MIFEAVLVDEISTVSETNIGILRKEVGNLINLSREIHAICRLLPGTNYTGSTTPQLIKLLGGYR